VELPLENETKVPSITNGFHLVVGALKLNGVGYHAASRQELAKALTDALASGKPALVNCAIDPTAGTENGHIGNLNLQSSAAQTN
jgi:thiamine pyrophosphate-dependent acetolactate synthase large subunit-like protein